MFRKNYFIPVLFIGLFIIGSISVFAQTATIGGTIQLKQAEGEPVPVDGAKIDCYRVDIKSGCISTKTNKKGEFFILGIPYNAKVVLAVSGEGISPIVSQEITPGNESVSIDVSAGDGKVFTEQRVREILEQAPTATVTSGELTKEQKAEQAKIAKETERIEAKNAKVQENNKRRSEVLTEGNAAYKKKEWDVAIAKYEEGYNIDPEYLGSAPIFLNYKAQALKERAVLNYNEAATSKDANRIRKVKLDVVIDFTAALDATTKAYNMTKNANTTDVISPEKIKADIKLSEEIVKDTFRLMGKMNVNLASNITTEEEANTAVSIYQGSLKMLPGDPDVLAGLSLALFSSSSFKGSNAEKQESLNYMALYMKTAPKDHTLREAISELVNFLTNEEKLKPQDIK